MATAEPSIQEEVLVRSSRLRIREFRVPTRCHLIPVIRDRLLEGIQEFRLATRPTESHFCMAIEEALANAFYHGNLELCSALKEDGSSRFLEFANEREQIMPYCVREVSIQEIAGTFGLWITIQDEGKGFDVAGAVNRELVPELLLSSGRGLMMMKAFADELFFNAVGNQVTLVLYPRRSAQAEEITEGAGETDAAVQRDDPEDGCRPTGA